MDRRRLVVVIAIRYHNKLPDCPRNRYIQSIRIRSKVTDLVIYCAEDHRCPLLPLELIHSIGFDVFLLLVKALFESFRLPAIRRHDTEIFSCRQMQRRQDLFFDHIHLPFIYVTARMVSGYSPVHHQRPLSFAFRHDDQLIVVEALVAESDDFRVTAVVFSQQNARRIRKDFHCGG